ncbi:MAG: DUF2156 domain-containing protein [Clostridia bacterium]|nr:DUF2156 domain-containing protein [Clostridia bacterium]
MTNSTLKKIDFSPVSLADRERYLDLLAENGEFGCEFSFANIYLWGRQYIAFDHGCAMLFSHFNRRSVYPFPVGNGDIKACIDDIIADSEARGIACRITGITSAKRELLEALYPDKFSFHCDDGTFDYVYAIDDLAELKGKKYHSKRNHYNRFCEVYEGYTVKPMTRDNASLVKEAAERWYKLRLEADPNADLEMERVALYRAFRDFDALGMDGIFLEKDGSIMAFTLGSFMDGTTFDVQFEKAFTEFNGAYAAVNCEFAQYLRNKYPNIEYLDREEDMGLEGLRKAKQSYHPHHQVKKCWALLKNEEFEY